LFEAILMYFCVRGRKKNFGRFPSFSGPNGPEAKCWRLFGFQFGPKGRSQNFERFPSFMGAQRARGKFWEAFWDPVRPNGPEVKFWRLLGTLTLTLTLTPSFWVAARSLVLVTTQPLHSAQYPRVPTGRCYHKMSSPCVRTLCRSGYTVKGVMPQAEHPAEGEELYRWLVAQCGGTP
jgi:hypothetical protein